MERKEALDYINGFGGMLRTLKDTDYALFSKCLNQCFGFGGNVDYFITEWTDGYYDMKACGSKVKEALSILEKKVEKIEKKPPIFSSPYTKKKSKKVTL
ncbi:hypothetical protein M0R19_03115 [Candidatus Pacearchaeota archaeon]|jgi:hypothetical protein|nr:hypothetical protein [Candidatus Pacearchaeota archaeon]